MIKTEAGEKMKKENPNKALPEKADINKDGEFQAWEKARHEAIKAAQAEDGAEMNMGGLMSDGMGVIIGIEAESGNEIPAGSKPEEVADDIPAMLSEGEYVVPADVVRWHGVKTFEELRCEAKMGMGLMAQDGRIAEVDDDYEHGHESPEYDIEEKDKPKVEKAKVEVVHAAEGKSLEEPATPTGGPYYGYRVVFDPQAKRYVFRPVAPETQEYVTTTDYDPTKSTRYTPEALLGSVYGEDQAVECPEGFYYDEEAGACMPEETPVVPSVVQPEVGGDGPEVDDTRVDYASQGLTKLAEQLGPLSAEDLKDVEGDTLADKAVNRMFTPAREVSMKYGPVGLAVTAVQNLYDNIGARRAAETRAQEFAKDPFSMQAYNFNFNPETGSFSKTSPTTQVTEMQDGWVTDYNNVGKSGTEYSRDDVFSSDIDDPNSAINDVFDGIDNDFANMTAVTGANNKPSGTESSGSDNNNENSSSGDRDASGDTSGGYGSDPSGGASGSPFAKGGYVTKKNKPKVATMQYSKGSK